MEEMVLSFSDQQLVTGLAILITTRTLQCQLSAYHFNLVCDYILMSVIVHVNTQVVATRYLDKCLPTSLRLFGITTTFCFAAFDFNTRNTPIFPMVNNSTLVILSPCFEVGNSSMEGNANYSSLEVDWGRLVTKSVNASNSDLQILLLVFSFALESLSQSSTG